MGKNPSGSKQKQLEDYTGHHLLKGNMMNKKAQAGPLAAIIFYLVFLLNWFLWLGNFINQMGANAVETNHLVGIEALAYSNLNIVVLVGMTLGMMAFIYLGGRR